MSDDFEGYISGTDLSSIVGKTLESIEAEEEYMLFVCTDGTAFNAYHMNACCEYVRIYDISGDLQSLVGSKIVEATAERSKDWPDDVEMHEDIGRSYTWTTHRFKTEAGAEVTVRWLGKSNGYYNEDVYFGYTHKPINAPATDIVIYPAKTVGELKMKDPPPVFDGREFPEGCDPITATYIGTAGDGRDVWAFQKITPKRC